MDDDKLYKAYRETVKKLNRDWLPRDEDEDVLAAEIALTTAYRLDRYTVPDGRKKRDKAATTAHTGGVLMSGRRPSSGEGGEPPCRELAKLK